MASAGARRMPVEKSSIASVQVALLLADLAADAVRQDALGVQFDRLLAIGQGAGEVFQAHADRRPRGVRLGVAGMQVHHGREVGQRGLEIGLGLFRGAGAIAIDAGAEEQRLGMVRIERQRAVQVRHRLVERAHGSPAAWPWPAANSVRPVRVRRPGWRRRGPAPSSPGQNTSRPARRSLPPSAASARRLRGNPPGPSPASRSCGSRCRGPGGPGRPRFPSSICRV